MSADDIARNAVACELLAQLEELAQLVELPKLLALDAAGPDTGLTQSLFAFLAIVQRRLDAAAELADSLRVAE